MIDMPTDTAARECEAEYNGTLLLFVQNRLKDGFFKCCVILL